MDQRLASKSHDDQDLVPASRTPRQTILWGVLGSISAAFGILIGSLYAMPAVARNQVGVSDPGSVTLAFGLTSCLFGIILAPVSGIIAGVASYGFNKTPVSGIVGALLGGLLYALLAVGFGIINIILSG